MIRKSRNNTQPTSQERSRRVQRSLIGAAAALVLTACGASESEPSQPVATAASSAPGTATPETTAPESSTPTTPSSSEIPRTPLQEKLNSRAGSGTVELTQLVLTLAGNLPESQAPVEPAGDDGSVLQYAIVNAGGTQYSMYAQLQSIEEGATSDNIQSLTVEVVNVPAEGGTTTPYWFTAMKSPEGADAWMLQVQGMDGETSWRASDDFSGAPGMEPGAGSVNSISELDAILSDANRVIGSAAAGRPLENMPAPY